MKKQNIKFVLGLLTFGILLACTQTPEQIAEKAKNSTVRLISQRDGHLIGHGSGFFIERDQIVTNIHVVAGADKVTVRLVGKEIEYTISGVVAFDAKNDLVILKTTEKSGKPLALGDSEIIQEEDEPIPIVIVGNHGGVEGNVAHGTLHGIRRDKWIRIKTGISEGEGVKGASGGPVLNSKGRVIGIVAGDTPDYTYAIPSTALIKIGPKKIESLSDWQNKGPIIVYDILNVVSKTSRDIRNAMQLNDIDEEKVKHLDDIIKSCTTVIENCKKLNLGRTFAAQVYDLRGGLWYLRGAYGKAIKDFEEVIRLIPDYDSSVYNAIGLSKFALGQSKFTLGQSKDDQKVALNLYKAAIIDLNEAIRDQGKAMEFLQDSVDIDQEETFKKDYANTYHSRGYMKLMLAEFYKSEGNKEKAQRLYKAAITDLDEAIRLNPDNVDTYCGRAIVKFMLGQSKDDEQEAQRLYKEVIKDYTKAITLKPDYADAYYKRGYMKQTLAEFYKSEGNKEKARHLYEEAIKDRDEAIRLDPNLKTSTSNIQKQAKEALEQLKK